MKSSQIDQFEIQQLSQHGQRRHPSASRKHTNSLTRAIAFNNQASDDIDSGSAGGQNQTDLIPLNGFMQDQMEQSKYYLRQCEDYSATSNIKKGFIAAIDNVLRGGHSSTPIIDQSMSLIQSNLHNVSGISSYNFNDAAPRMGREVLTEDMYDEQRACSSGFRIRERFADDEEDFREHSPMVIKQQKLFDDFPMGSNGLNHAKQVAQQTGSFLAESGQHLLPLLSKKDTSFSESSEPNQNCKKRTRKACTKRNQKQ